MNEFTRVSLMDIQMMDKSFDLDQAIAQNEVMKKNNQTLITILIVAAGVTAFIVYGYLREQKERKSIELQYATDKSRSSIRN